MINLQLLPIQEKIEDNSIFEADAACHEALFMTMTYYKVIGFVPPWIGYFAQLDNQFVGAAGFKGRPKQGKIEIAYGTFPLYQQKGIGTEICRQLILLSLRTDPSMLITARTLPENNFSTKILKKNNFKFAGTVWDEDDGDVWEWHFENDLSKRI